MTPIYDGAGNHLTEVTKAPNGKSYVVRPLQWVWAEINPLTMQLVSPPKPVEGGPYAAHYAAQQALGACEL